MKIRRFLIVLISLIFASAIFLVLQNQMRKMTLQKRIEDVRHLAEVGTEFQEGTNINQLISALSARGVTLHNPLAIDKKLPGYRIGKPGVSYGSVIEENDKVADNELRVRSMVDGSVVVTLKDEKR